MAKIISFKKACELSKKFRKEGKKVVFTSGCFDILHIGHIGFFKSLFSWAGPKAIIILGVDTDEYLRINKGNNRPVFTQMIRAEILSMIKGLDYIVLLKDKGKEGSLFATQRYKKLSPSAVVFGNIPELILEKIKTECIQVGCNFKHLPHKTKLESTSRLAKIILDNFSS